MMRKFFYLGTAAFWLAVIGIWLGSLLGTAPPAVPLAAPAIRSIVLSEVAQHAHPEDCWMAINGQVYDVSAYLPDHPSKPSIIEPWCGREASEAYRTKTKGRSHSADADRLLARYLIGRLGE